MKRFLLILLVLCALPMVMATQKHITVLSVSDANTSQGSTADIYLDVRPGNGAVYIDSFPLTKLDTQLSARFAREYACQLADRDCSKLDFFYVIRARSTIIGGPSAGGAMTVLAYAALENLPIRQDTVMTGTINSGGLLGPVGGVPAKIDAARASNFSKVLVPAAEYNASLANITGIDVIPVRDVETAIWYFTGKDIRPKEGNLTVPVQYSQTMQSIAQTLCSRADGLANETAPTNESIVDRALAVNASDKGDYYSAASFCFAADLSLRTELLSNQSQDYLRSIYRQLRVDIQQTDNQLPKNFTTISDLEIYMVVRERLMDASNTLDKEDYQHLNASGVAYALERFNSALAWSTFFGKLPSERLDLSTAQLQQSCDTKLAEAEERLNYITYLTTIPLTDTRTELSDAYDFRRQKEYALCVFKASKAKAEADSVISALYSGNDLNKTVQLKIEKARELLSQSAQRRSFPVLSYSYYQYAKDLKDPYSANLYADYALELGSLDIYFTPRPPSYQVDFSRAFLFAAGIAIGFAGGVLARELFVRKPKRRK